MTKRGRSLWGANAQRAVSSWLLLVAGLLVAGLFSARAGAQSGFEDDRVMLQGFYWESYRHGNPSFPYGSRRWYEIVRDTAPAIADARFDLVWLPPVSFAGDVSAGYNPKRYFRLDNSYGSFQQHRAALGALLGVGVEPIADIVVNHRDGIQGWADFQEPSWGTWSVCASDEAFRNPASEVNNTPAAQRGNCEESTPYAQLTYAYPDFRDLAHTDKRVRDDVVRYLLQLRSLGYRGWRYDMVHGYHGKWIACYNAASKPTFSVGEFDWGAHDQQRGWIWASSTNTSASVVGADHLRSSSDVFDFTSFFALKAINDGRYTSLYGFGNGIGMVGDTTDGLPWKNRAVTFVENHDTGYRTEENGTPQANHRFDSFANGWQVEQAYAHVLTHPGVPTVYWKHYFDWGGTLQSRIKALINARKVAGVHAGSGVDLQNNAAAAGVYAARVNGRRAPLYVRIGGSDAQWQPSSSQYANYREYAAGDGWKVWVGLPGNPPVQQAPRRQALPVPTYTPADQIRVPDVVQCR